MNSSFLSLISIQRKAGRTKKQICGSGTTEKIQGSVSDQTDGKREKCTTTGSWSRSPEKKKHMSGALRKVMVIFAVLFVLMGITISQAFMLPGFLLALLYFVYDIFSQRDYEYTMENGQLTIDVIYGKKYRKTAHVLNLEEMEVTAPHYHEKVAKYKKNSGTEKLKKYDYTSYEDDVPYYTMIIREDGRKIKLLLDLTEEMLHTMKTQFPEKVYFA